MNGLLDALMFVTMVSKSGDTSLVMLDKEQSYYFCSALKWGESAHAKATIEYLESLKKGYVVFNIECKGKF